MFDRQLSFGELKKKYKKKLGKNISPHHMIPSSRGGAADQFNLFPWDKECHFAWHEIFVNMTVFEVWERLDDIYDSIFNSNSERIIRWWLDVCKIPDRGEKARMLEKEVSVEKLQDAWFECFESEEFAIAANWIKYMLLFMVIGGEKMMKLKIFFERNNLEIYLNKKSLNKYRAQAFIICFGEDEDDSSKIEFKIRKIIKKSKSSLL